jgi:hypothetical protein
LTSDATSAPTATKSRTPAHRARHDPALPGDGEKGPDGHDARGKPFDHWQIEVTGGGRIWYLVDTDKATIWFDYAGPGHPKATG